MPKHNIIHIEIPDEEATQSRELHEKLFGWNIIPLLDLNYANREFKAEKAHAPVNEKDLRPNQKRTISPGPPQFR
jgi:hypothetical protein